MMNNDYKEEYVTINGIPQYLLHYSQENKPVLLFLHGGPGAAEHLMAHKLNPYFSEIVTQVHWDQRGAGKTLLKNKQNGTPESLEQMMEDLHQVVLYLQKVYHTQKIILLGHSFGTIIGSLYAIRHPENVLAYIGSGQVISMMENEREGFCLAKKCAKQSGNHKQLQMLDKLEGYPTKDKELLMKQLPKVHQLVAKEASGMSSGEMLQIMRKSPCFHFSDIMSILKSSGVNRQLIMQILDFDLRDYSKHYQVPVHYILGESDYTTPVSITQKYFEEIDAVEKSCVVIPGAGHNLMYEKTKEYTRELHKIVQNV